MMPRSGIRLLMLCLVSASCLPAALAAERQSVPLNSGWEFRQKLTAPGAAAVPWKPAQVPGDVHLDLLHNNMIPEPFYRQNEAKLQWIENADWEYQSTLQATAQMLAHPHVELVFEGLDAVAMVYVNGQQVLAADNMFREWRTDIRAALKPGANTLLVVFPSPIKAAEKVADKDPWQPKTQTEAKTYIRKAAYEYGWDWGPRFVTSGIWRPAHLDLWDEARIADLYVHQLSITANLAQLSLETAIEATADTTGKLNITYEQGGQKKSVSQAVMLHAGTNTVNVPLAIPRPALWYPSGYGAQPMYNFHAELTAGRSTLDERSARAGLRSVVLRRDLDQWGRSFEFDVNGIPVFAKGADVIPFDSFPSRVTTEQYRRILQSAKDANMNMIRHWGGGYYETDEFYSMCDELGIMVWQDFMFGNDWQPGTYAFKQEMEREAEYQVTRLRNHPSIVIWSGNNETELAFHWKGRDQLPNDVRMRMWQDYVSEFSGVLARTVARLNAETPYWPSSPSSDYEDTSKDFESGDMHDWSVWHGNAEFDEYEKHFPRFVTEYGFQSFPEMKTVEAFTKPEDRTSIFTPVMLAHQKNNAGNSIIRDYMLKYYGEPKDFASFLYASQVLQAESMKIGAEHFRRLRPRTMGSIYWQLNDCWPVASWSSIDYYGRWKALQYYARRFYAPTLVSPHVEDGKLAVYIVSDNTVVQQGQLHLRIMDFSGKVLQQQTQAVTVGPLSSKPYIELPLSTFANANGTDAAAIFGAVDLTVAGNVVSSNMVYFAPTKLIHLPTPNIQTELAAAASGSFKLKLTSPVLAKGVYVSFGSLDATYSDNYIDLLPNEPQSIAVTSSASAEQLKQQMEIMTMADAFAPPPDTPPAAPPPLQ